MSDMKIVNTPAAPAALGPYSQAMVASGFVFASGQVALDPATGELTGVTAADQAKQVLKNLQAVLEAAGTSLARVVKTTVYLTDLEAFAAVNSVYEGYFGETRPARATVQVSALPKGALVEIDAVAVAGA